MHDTQNVTGLTKGHNKWHAKGTPRAHNRAHQKANQKGTQKGIPKGKREKSLFIPSPFCPHKCRIFGGPGFFLL